MTRNPKFAGMKKETSIQLLSSQSVSPNTRGARQHQNQSTSREAFSSTTHRGPASDTNRQSRQLFELLCDHESDTQQEQRAKEAVSHALSKESKKRTKENLQTVGHFLQRYRFFEKLKGAGTEETYTAVMRAV